MQLRQTTIKRHLFLCTWFALIGWRVDLSNICIIIRLIYFRLFLRWPRCYLPRRNFICIIHIWHYIFGQVLTIRCNIFVLRIYRFLRWFLFLYLRIWVIIGYLSEFTDIGSSKKIILNKYVPQRTVVDLVVENDLLEAFLVDQMIIDYWHSFGCVNRRKLAAPREAVAKNTLQILLRVCLLLFVLYLCFILWLLLALNLFGASTSNLRSLLFLIVFHNTIKY